METARKDLMNYDEKDLTTLPLDMARPLAEQLGVEDNGFEGPQDMRERLLLMRRAMQKSGHKPWFLRVQAEAAAKRRNLLEILRNITGIFKAKFRHGNSSLLIEALSAVLIQERLLSKHNLLDELADREQALQARETLIIVAGETNSGKSTFLNVILGQNILPTDVLHCTYVVCKIVYSHSYVVETLDYHGHYEEYHCKDCDEARAQLKEVVTCDNLKGRQQSSCFKEITLKMPAEILKSGITFVDTPGIGENEAMDGVTISFVREAQASAFIYIIKSDGAGGVQEDRLLAFLRAVKENYKNDRLEGTFDPQAAMFVCHRWDTINPSEVEKVRKNALMRLETVWPGFRPSQTFLFSSKKAKLHLDIDPDFITDSFNDLLNGLKQVIDRATHNAIKYQYCWIKTFLQPACRHLRSMISNCTVGKEELDEHFRDVAEKQERLMKQSSDQVPMYEKMLADQRAFLRLKVKEILSLNEVKFSIDFEDYDELLSLSKEDNSESRQRLRYQIIMCLVKYCDDYLLREKILKPIEDSILQEIKEHLGLLEEQTKQIKVDIQGTEIKRSGALLDLAGSTSKLSLNSSHGSSLSWSSETDDVEEANIPDPTVLNLKVNDFLKKNKSAGKLGRAQKTASRLLDHLRTARTTKSDLTHSLHNRIEKLAAAISLDEGVIDDFVSRYLHFSERCIKHAINCIPNFIAVNTELMNKIREHREAFLKDKQRLKEVMEDLEPYRAQLQGYGVLYMEDVHADQIRFITERKTSTVKLQPGIMVSARPNDDSGFVDSGSTRRRTRGFWTHLQNATMIVDDNLMGITIKTYSFILEDSEQYSEIAALRCLEHMNVASFFGMTHVDSANPDEDEESKQAPRLPAFIFKGHLWSANVYRKMKLVNLQEFVPTFLIELWQGLDFIHMENLVHLELNLDTVMVDSETGTVKLCQHCKPREAQLPLDLSCKTNAAICLSPSALQGNVYQISDDIYAFGLLLWQMLYPKTPPYEEQRNWTLKKFIDEVHPSKMLKPVLESLNASSSVKTILDGCLICTKGTIITMKDIFSFREQIEQDPAIVDIRNPRSKPLEMRSNSLQTSDSVQLTDRSMDESTTRDLTHRRMSFPTSKTGCPSPIPVISVSGEKPTRPPRQKHRPDRHSEIVAPNLSELDIPARHGGRKTSLPTEPLMNYGEKCQSFQQYVPESADDDYHRGGDEKVGSIKRKERFSMKLTSRNTSKKIYDPLVERRNSTGIMPTVKIDPPCEQEADLNQSWNFRSTSPFARQAVNPSSGMKYNPPTQFANENTSLPGGPRDMYESVRSPCESSIDHSENDPLREINSLPHGSLGNSPSINSFGRRGQRKLLRRGDAVRVSPTSQIDSPTCNEHGRRRNTEGNVQPLLEEQGRSSRLVKSQTFPLSDDHVTDSKDDTGIWISDSSSSLIRNDGEKVTQQGNISKPRKAVIPVTNFSEISENDSLLYQPNKGIESPSSDNALDSANQRSSPSIIITNDSESEHSIKNSDGELNESSCSESRSISPFCPVINSAAPAFPCVKEWDRDNIDTDCGQVAFEADDLPPVDLDDLSF